MEEIYRRLSEHKVTLEIRPISDSDELIFEFTKDGRCRLVIVNAMDFKNYPNVTCGRLCDEINRVAALNNA